jgi:hypothetical protein
MNPIEIFGELFLEFLRRKLKHFMRLCIVCFGSFIFDENILRCLHDQMSGESMPTISLVLHTIKYWLPAPRALTKY